MKALCLLDFTQEFEESTLTSYNDYQLRFDFLS